MLNDMIWNAWYMNMIVEAIDYAVMFAQQLTADNLRMRLFYCVHVLYPPTTTEHNHNWIASGGVTHRS